MPRKRKQKDTSKQSKKIIDSEYIQSPSTASQQSQPRRSQRLKNKNNPSNGSKLSGDKHYLFSHQFQLTKAQKKNQSASPYPIISRCKRKMKLINHKPNVFVIDNFLTENEINHLLHIADVNKSKFEGSFTQATSNDDQIYSKERTSTFIFLQKYMDKTSRNIERRAADIVSIPVENVEPLQMVRYTEGQQFTLHHDGGTLVDLDSSSETSNCLSSEHMDIEDLEMDIDLSDEHESETDLNGNNFCQNCSKSNSCSSASMINKSMYIQNQNENEQKCQQQQQNEMSQNDDEFHGNYSVHLVRPIRLFSFFVYLTTIPHGKGGETIFPKLGIKIRPERGKAILWSNVCPNNVYKACTKTVHRAYPIVGKDEKLGLNIWIDANGVE